MDSKELVAHAGFLRALARSLVRDDSSADDVVQETWIAALVHPPRDRQLLKTWHGTVARNVVKLRGREEGRRANRERLAWRPREIEAADVLLAREQAMESLRAALESLPEHYRVIVVLRFYDDLPPREIAEKLDLPVETVKTRLKRALVTMRERLDSEHGGDRKAWCLLLVPLLGPMAQSRAATGPAASGGPPPRTGLARNAVVAAGVVGILVSVAIIVQRFALDRDTTTSPPASDGVAALAPEEVPRDAQPVGESSATEPASRAGVARSEGEGRRTEEGSIGSLVVTVTWDDGTAAAGIRGTVVRRSHMVILYGHLLDRVTDSHGSFRVDRLTPGDVDVWIDRGRHGRASIADGQESTLAISIPPGLAVEGSVVDPAGQPVSGADVVYCPTGYEDSAARVATTDATGAFRLRSIRGGWIGAVHPSFAPSRLTSLPANSIGNHSLRLVLPGPGGSIVGRILAPDGEGVAAARVILGSQELDVPLTAKDLSSRRVWTESDAEGRIAARALPAGSVPIEVSKEGFARYLGVVEVAPSTQTSVDVRLEAGGTLIGTVRDEEGRAVPHALVIVTRESLAGSKSLKHSVRADESGAFRLSPLASGRVTVSATGADNLGSASAWVILTSGDAARCDLVLSRGRQIWGFATDADGSPLSGWTVASMAVPEWDTFNTHSGDTAGFEIGECVTDSAGRFGIANRPNREHRVEVFDPAAWAAQPSLVTIGVCPSDEPLRLRIHRDSIPSAFIAGRLVDSEGRPLGGVELSVWWVDAWRWLGSIPVGSDGAFRLGPLASGRFDVTMETHELRTTLLEEFSLSAGEERDVGAVHVPATGSLVATFREDGERSPMDVPIVQILDRRGERCAEPTLSGDTLRVENLPKGSYRLAVEGSSRAAVASDQWTFEIEAGREARLDVRLRPGVARTLALAGPAGKYWAGWVQLVVRDSSGRIVHSRRVDRTSGTLEDTEGIAWVVTLGRGAYRVDAVSDLGMRAQQSIEITDLVADPAPIEIRLPAPPLPDRATENR